MPGQKTLRQFNCLESGDKCTDPRCTITMCCEQIRAETQANKKNGLKKARTYLSKELRDLIDLNDDDDSSSQN